MLAKSCADANVPTFLSIENSLVDTVIEPHVSFHWLRKLDGDKFRKHLGEDQRAWQNGGPNFVLLLMALSYGEEISFSRVGFQPI